MTGVNTKAIAALAAGIVALGAGLVCLGNRDRVETPPPAAMSFDETFAVLGDSYAEGAGADWETGWVNRISDQMCWTLVKVSAQGGTGYVASRSDPGHVSFPNRVDRVATDHPGIILVQGGLNDTTAPSEEITSAAAATFADLARRAAGATIVVIGPVQTPMTDPAEVARVGAAIAAAATERGVHYLDPVKEGWVADARYFVDDGFHLNPDGYGEYARKLGDALKRDGLQPSCG